MESKIKLYGYKNKIEFLVFSYILIQPFLDIYINYFKNPIQIFGIAINAFVNVLLFMIILLYYFKTRIYKTKISNTTKKDIYVFLIYLVIFLIYSVLHYLNMQKFDTHIFDVNTFGYFKETYFMARSFVLPIMLLLILYRLNFNQSKILLWIKTSVFIICFIIVISNLFGISLASYAEHGKLVYIDGNIFHWPFFSAGDNFDLYTSKGWFRSANEISAILLSLAPIILYSFFANEKAVKREKIFDGVLVALLVLTMNMLGTRTASFGMLAILFVCILLLVVLMVKKVITFNRKLFIKKSLLVVISFLVLFFLSPFYNSRYGIFKKEFEERPLKQKVEEEDKIYGTGFEEYMRTHYWYFYVDPILLDIYPVNNDKVFWKNIINRDLRLNNNYRIIKTDIYNRILERNNNKFDYIFGIGYNDVLNSERDYAMQLYHYGVVGILVLIGPLIFCVLYVLIKFLRSLSKKINLSISFCLLGNIIGILVPYLTGHIFGLVFPMTYVTLNILLLLQMKKEMKL